MTKRERIDRFELELRRLDLTIPPRLLFRTTASLLSLEAARKKLAVAVREGDLRAIATAEKTLGACVEDVGRHLRIVNRVFFPLVDFMKIGRLVLADDDRSAMN